MTKEPQRSPIVLPDPTIPDNEMIRKLRDQVLVTLLDTVAGAEILGGIVRYAWVVWARSQPNPKPSWLVPWEQLPEADKEADRQIGLAVARYVVEAMIRVSYPTRIKKEVRPKE